MSTPYTYLIGWSKNNLWYYGCQYNRNADPSQLWKTYFTSSAKVASLRKILGEPDVVEVRKTFEESQICTKWEGKVLRRLRLREKKHQWLNRAYHDSSGLVKFVNEGMPESAKLKISNKTIGVPKSEDAKARMKAAWTSDRKQTFTENNTPWNKGIPMTPKARQHLAEVNTGKKRDPNWNKTGPKKGTTQSPEHAAKRLAAFKATLATPEMKAKKSQSVKGRRFYTNGARRFLLHPTDSKISKLNLRIGYD